MKKRILIISSPSGTGKSTLITELVKQREEFRLVKSVTDRKPRYDGEPYTFVSTEEFERMQSQGKLMESNVYAKGCHYGTPLLDVQSTLKKGYVPILDIDVNGHDQVLEAVKMWKNCQVISVFVIAPAETIYQRLIDRQTESIEEIIERLRIGAEEIRKGKSYDEVITNDKLEQGVSRLYRAYRYCIEGKSEADEIMLITDDMMNVYDLDTCASSLQIIADRLDDKDSVKALSRRIEQFCSIRGWMEKNTAKDLAIGVSTEGNELLDIFRFKTEEQVAEILADPAHREHVGEELADTHFFILRFCATFGFDPGEILVDKIYKNGKKYPVKK